MKKWLIVANILLLLVVVGIESYAVGLKKGLANVTIKEVKGETEYVAVDSAQDERVIWALIQDWRIRTGRTPYIEDLGLCAIAVERADKANREFNHDEFYLRGGKYMEQYGFNLIGENLVKLQESSTAALEGWLDSPSHRENLENSMFTHGCVRCLNFTCAHIFGAR